MERERGAAKTPPGYPCFIRAASVAASLRPFPFLDGPERELRGIDDHVLHPLPFPGVGDVDQAVGRLDDGGIGVFARFVFESGGCLPGFAVTGSGKVEGAAARGGVVVNEEVLAAL